MAAVVEMSTNSSFLLLNTSFSSWNQTPMTLFSAYSDDDLLQRLSDRRAWRLLPVFFVFGLVFLFGTVGNSLTVYIYMVKFKATWSRTAIVALGIFDLMSCLIAIPGELADLRFSYNYNSDVLCRASRALATFPSIASGIMLTTVAFDRYRLICCPHRTSPLRRSSRKHVLLVSCLSLLVTWPAAAVYGTKTIDTGVHGVLGKECSTSDWVKGTKFPLAYNIVLSCVFIFAFVSMIVFYVLIGRQIYRQGEFRKTLMNIRDSRRKSTKSDLEASLASDPDAGRDLSQGDSSEQKPDLPAHDPRKSAEVGRTDLNVETNDQQSSKEENQASPVATSLSSSFRRKLNLSHAAIARWRKQLSSDSSSNYRTRKTTLMLCLISIVFVLSFLPHLAIKLVQILDKSFLKEASSGRLVVYNLCVRSYFLNSVANVFIYGFCSFRFRRECVKVLKKLLLWKICRR